MVAFDEIGVKTFAWQWKGLNAAKPQYRRQTYKRVTAAAFKYESAQASLRELQGTADDIMISGSDRSYLSEKTI